MGAGLRPPAPVTASGRYMAPEILQGEPYGKEVDWWTLGILVYQVRVGALGGDRA